MRVPALFLLLAASALGQMRMVGPIHQPIQYAQTLADGRVLVLTPQRLVLLGSAPDHTELAAFINQRQVQRSFVVYEDIVYLQEAARQIHLLDLTDGLKPLPPIPMNISHFGSPPIADGHLFAIESFRKLKVFSLADPRTPKVVGELQLPNHAAAYRLTVHEGHAYMFSRGRIYAVDVRNPQLPEMLSQGLELRVESPGATFGIGSRLYAFTGKKLAVLAISNPSTPTLITEIPDVPICNDIVPRGDGVLAYRNETRLSVHPTAEGAKIEDDIDELPMIGGDAASLRAAAFWPEAGFRGAFPIDDSQVCVLDGITARVVDLSIPQAPKIIGESPFDVSYRPSYARYQGIVYVPGSICELRKPRSAFRCAPTSAWQSTGIASPPCSGNALPPGGWTIHSSQR